MVDEEVEVDVEIKSPANKFHIFARRSQHVSKATRYIQGWDLLEGEWDQVGSIVFWKLVFGNSKNRSLYIPFTKIESQECQRIG
uniref:Bet v I/Major latex protein domain-containing protein n=1 Tax=Noccaea caerulescens TaxID=107243 RepID=A0A1J3J3Y3_NOCCA